jgi:hypothetical protein
LQAALAHITPGGGSPAYPALLGTLSLATAQKDAHPDHQVVALFVTAGYPDTCGGQATFTVGGISAEDPAAYVALAADARTYDGVLTYVVGPENGDTTFLASVAQAGGTNAAYVASSAPDVQAFTTSVNALRASSLPCRLPIPSTARGTSVHASAGGKSYVVTALADASACSGLPGWYPDSTNGKAYVQLCPASCSVLQGDASAAIDIVDDCASDAGAADAVAEAAGDAGACTEDCTQLNPPSCYTATCDAATGACAVVPSPAGTSCDDGRFCTVSDACDGHGVCTGKPNTCGLGACDQPLCNEDSRKCTPNPAAEGASCIPDGLCAAGGECHNGQCVATTRSCAFFPVPAPECSTMPQCNAQTGACEATPANDYSPCPDDGDQCKSGKTCLGGMCQGGTPKDCSYVVDACNTAGCDPTIGCIGTPVADGTPCGLSSVCAAFGCGAGTCKVNAINQGGACSDGNACTANDTCGASGTCQGTPTPAGYQSYFNDPLTDNAQGWTLTGPSEWQIAPEGALPACTAAPESGFALWTNNAKIFPNATTCLVSPPIDASKASRLWLEFSHQIQLDGYNAFTVDVFNGTLWNTVFWTGLASDGYSPLDECSWVPESIDITTSKWSGLQVRFCAQVYYAGTALLENVVVANQPCQVGR